MRKPQIHLEVQVKLELIGNKEKFLRKKSEKRSKARGIRFHALPPLKKKRNQKNPWLLRKPKEADEGLCVSSAHREPREGKKKN